MLGGVASCVINSPENTPLLINYTIDFWAYIINLGANVHCVIDPLSRKHILAGPLYNQRLALKTHVWANAHCVINPLSREHILVGPLHNELLGLHN